MCIHESALFFCSSINIFLHLSSVFIEVIVQKKYSTVYLSSCSCFYFDKFITIKAIVGFHGFLFI